MAVLVAAAACLAGRKQSERSRQLTKFQLTLHNTQTNKHQMVLLTCEKLTTDPLAPVTVMSAIMLCRKARTCPPGRHAFTTSLDSGCIAPAGGEGGGGQGSGGGLHQSVGIKTSFEGSRAEGGQHEVAGQCNGSRCRQQDRGRRVPPIHPHPSAHPAGCRLHTPCSFLALPHLKPSNSCRRGTIRTKKDANQNKAKKSEKPPHLRPSCPARLPCPCASGSARSAPDAQDAPAARTPRPAAGSMTPRGCQGACAGRQWCSVQRFPLSFNRCALQAWA